MIWGDEGPNCGSTEFEAGGAVGVSCAIEPGWLEVEGAEVDW